MDFAEDSVLGSEGVVGKIEFDSFGKSRAYKLLLFADNKEHMKTLNKLKRIYSERYVGIWHIQHDDSGEEIIDDSGKKHAHVMLVFDNPVSWKNLVKVLCADPRFCMPIVLKPSGSDEFIYKKCNVDGGYCYLTHVNSPDKEQYPVEALWGSPALLDAARLAIVAYLARKSALSECVVQAVRWIRQHSDFVSYSEFALWLAGTPYFKAGSSPLVRGALQEHNDRIRDQLANNRRDELSQSYAKYSSVQAASGFDVRGYWKHEQFEDFFDPLADDDEVIF